MEVTWIGHATVLLRVKDRYLLTDPIWSHRTDALFGISATRLTPAALPLEGLPHVDLVLISHDHPDHCDLPTIKQLHLAVDPVFVIPRGLSPWLTRLGISKIVELDRWNSTKLESVTITAVPAKHWAGRTPLQFNRTPALGFLVQGGEEGFYFTGDTGFSRELFTAISRAVPRITLSALPISWFAPLWYRHRIHLNAEEAVQAHQILGSQKSFAMHHSAFELGIYPWGHPLKRLKKALTRSGIAPDDFWVLRPGETRALNGTVPTSERRQPDDVTAESS